MPGRFHQVQYLVMAGLALFFALAYMWAPASKSEFLGGCLTICLGFVAGKFSNGFSRSRPTRWDDAPDSRLPERKTTQGEFKQ